MLMFNFHCVFGMQVLEVVRSNYDTLTLKLQDGLDQYERYSEQHKEASFFKELVSFNSLIKGSYNWLMIQLTVAAIMQQKLPVYSQNV